MRKDMSELTPRQRSQISALKRMPDDQIDTSDIPEVLNWSNATRGAFYSPGRKHVGRAIGSTTDTSEKGLERLICEALTGAADAIRRRRTGSASGRPATAWAGYAEIRGTTTGGTALTWPSLPPSSMPPSPMPRNRWTWGRTVRRGASS